MLYDKTFDNYENVELEKSDYSDLSDEDRVQMETFEKCLEKSTEAHVGVYIKELMFKDARLVAERDVKDKIVSNESVTPLLRITGEYAYLDLVFEYEQDPGLLAINYLLEQWLDRSMNGFQLKGGNAKMENLIVHLSTYDKDENGNNVTYIMEFVNPAFFYKYEKRERLSFPISNFTFGIDTTDLSEVTDQIEYDELMNQLAQSE